MEPKDVLIKLKCLSNPKNIEGMARFGINPKNTYGVSMPELRKLAKEIGKSHKLALELWKSGVHEARIVAGLIDLPEEITETQMDDWAAEFDSWDVCDQTCMNIFWETKVAYKKASEWSKRKEEFVKRAGFAMMAVLAWKDKKFEEFFPAIKKESSDDRNYVKKAVNWALRQIGKRSQNLNKKALFAAEEIQKTNSKAAKWIATDAIRELRKAKIGKVY
jgi:3-methyladenine DNA glycosylase AlkD